MKNDNRYSRHNYNDDWDAHADRDRYERDYYQNRRYRPQGYSYNSEREMHGDADYNRHGTGYAENDYERYHDRDRYGVRMGSDYRHQDEDRRRRYDNRDFENDRTRYGYSENPNYGYYGRNSQRGDDYNWNRGRRSHPHDRDRNWWDKTTDEVASWFGDNEAENRRVRDERTDHHGKGTKGYKRSDEKIKSDLEDELYDDSYIDASDMEVTVKDAIVTLTGSVDSKWIKRRAEDIAETISGVDDVRDNLIVRKESQRNSENYYSNSETGARARSGTGDMTSNTEHKTGNTQKVKS